MRRSGIVRATDILDVRREKEKKQKQGEREKERKGGRKGEGGETVPAANLRGLYYRQFIVLPPGEKGGRISEKGEEEEEKKKKGEERRLEWIQ